MRELKGNSTLSIPIQKCEQVWANKFNADCERVNRFKFHNCRTILS